MARSRWPRPVIYKNLLYGCLVRWCSSLLPSVGLRSGGAGHRETILGGVSAKVVPLPVVLSGAERHKADLAHGSSADRAGYFTTVLSAAGDAWDGSVPLARGAFQRRTAAIFSTSLIILRQSDLRHDGWP
jgi:hypothetical protein